MGVVAVYRVKKGRKDDGEASRGPGSSSTIKMEVFGLQSASHPLRVLNSYLAAYEMSSKSDAVFNNFEVHPKTSKFSRKVAEEAHRPLHPVCAVKRNEHALYRNVPRVGLRAIIAPSLRHRRG